MSRPIVDTDQHHEGTQEEYFDWRIATLQDPRVDSADINQAFQDLWLECMPTVGNTIYKLTRTSHRVEELSQEVALKVFRSIDSFTPENASSLHAWVGTIARNVTIDMFKSEARFFTTFANPLDGSTESAEIFGDTIWGSSQEDASPEAAAELRELCEFIDGLPPHFADVLRLHYVEDLPEDQVAELLGIRPGTVKSRIHRAKKYLRGMLEDFVA